MENIIKQFALENNLIFGICDAKGLSIEPNLLKLEHTPFVKNDYQLRTDPSKSFSEAKSIIVLGIGYNKKVEVIEDDIPRGKISLYAVGFDYHVKLKNLLNQLAAKLSLPASDFKIFVDSGYLVERELAKKAGLGWLGKNCSVISDKFGGYFNLGYILTSADLRPTKGYEPYFSLCGNCTNCIDACPGNALSKEGFSCNHEKCVSYITQKKGVLSQPEQDSIKNMLFGCDVCLAVCPHQGEFTDTINKIDAYKPSLDSILQLSKSDFNLIYKNTAAGWRGLSTLKRNANVILNNYYRNKP